MRAKIAKQLIAGIGISAITLFGTAVIARADPPPDKKQHEKHAQPAQTKPKAQPQAQRPAEQAQHQPPQKQPPHPQQHAAQPVERAKPARASREQPKEIRGGAPQKQQVRAVPRPIPPPPARNWFNRRFGRSLNCCWKCYGRCCRRRRRLRPCI
jgi:hypothetical protein